MSNRFKIDWNNVDWSKTNKDIATELNTSTDYVSQRRKIHAPKTVGKVHHNQIEAKKRWKGTRWSLGASKICKSKGVSDVSVYRAARRYKAKLKIK